MKILHQHKLYLPALSIVAVVLLLLLLMGISTYRNLDHEKQTALQFTYRKGLTIIRALEAGARAGMRMSMWAEDSIQDLIRETGKSEDIAYIYLINSQGHVVHHSMPAFKGMHSIWKPALKEKNNIATRVRKDPSGLHVYEIAKRFSPLPPIMPKGPANPRLHQAHMLPAHQHVDARIILGLNLSTFEQARRADIHHALIMAAIVIALGSGAIFFIFVIQNYYLVDKALKQSEDYTRQVIANMPGGLLSIDSDGRIMAYNQLALDLLGIKEPDIRHANLKNFLEFENAVIPETITRCKPVLDREIACSGKSGQVVPLGLSATPIMDRAEQCSGAVIILRDLREIKRLEDQVRRSEKLAAIGKLSAGVAHEIRNPLSSIRGFAQYLKNVLSDRPKESEYAEIMVQEVDRVNRVVTDLLTFARPMTPETAPTDIDRLIAHAIRLVAQDAETKDVFIQNRVAEALQAIAVDKNQITQALLNLLLNALHAVHEGGKIEVGADMGPGGDVLQIWVKDDGPGISQENLSKIFDPFFTKREKGTGLGLSIVHKIVEAHGGEIIVETTEFGNNTGSKFIITLPVIVED